jgi:hypothetical protein
MLRSNEGYSEIGFFKNLESLEQKRKTYFNEPRNNYGESQEGRNDSEPFNMFRPSFDVRRSPFDVRRSPSDVQMAERNSDVDAAEKDRNYFFESEKDRIVDIDNEDFQISEPEPRKILFRSNSKNYDNFYGNFQTR